MLFNQAVDIPEILTSRDVTVTLLEERARYNLRLKPADIAAIKTATGLKLPAKIGGSSSGKGVTSLKLGPDEWMVIAEPKLREKLEASLAEISGNFMCSITDISHRNVAFEISGQGAAKLINVGCPMDLAISVFPVGKVSRTIFESAPILLLRNGEDKFHVECWRSYGPYLRDYFTRVVTTR